MKSGLSLIEILIVVAIILIIGGASFGLLSAGNISWHSSSTALTVEQELRRGIVFMTEELERAGSSVIVGVPADGKGYNSISFRVPQDNDGNGNILNKTTGNIEWSNAIVYQLVYNASLGSYQLTRTQGSSTRVLANYLPTPQSFQIKRSQSTPNNLEIELEVQKKSPLGHTINRSISSRVTLRNP